MLQMRVCGLWNNTLLALHNYFTCFEPQYPSLQNGDGTTYLTAKLWRLNELSHREAFVNGLRQKMGYCVFPELLHFLTRLNKILDEMDLCVSRV